MTINEIKAEIKACEDWIEWEKYADFMNWYEVNKKEARIRELEEMLREMEA